MIFKIARELEVTKQENHRPVKVVQTKMYAQLNLKDLIQVINPPPPFIKRKLIR